jgi:hypothetical protein
MERPEPRGERENHALKVDQRHDSGSWIGLRRLSPPESRFQSGASVDREHPA